MKTTQSITAYFQTWKTYFSAMAKYHPNSILVYRNTAHTHFADNGPKSKFWECRSRDRIECLNAVADEAYKDTAEEDRKWITWDVWTMSDMRPDCTPDNRHYTKGNCEDTFATNMFLTIHNHIENQ